MDFGKILKISKQAEKAGKLDKKLVWKIQYIIIYRKVQ